MRTRNFASVVVFLLCVSSTTFADRQLEKSEILQIFQKLTSQPRKTWISAGIIKATYEEYRAPKTMDANVINSQINKEIQQYLSDPNKRELTQELQKMRHDAIPFNTQYRLSNEYTMSSSVVVKFDGDRFYWEINVDSRTDSVKPGKDLTGNFMTKQFNLDWNARRIFAWDGEKYTTYFLPGNHAIVDATGKTPHVVNGPLTVGIIRWGYGYYKYENLSATDSSAVEKYIDGQTRIYLTLNNPDGSQMVFVMDPQKDYAVMSCLITGHNDVVIAKYYSDYQSIAGNWVPSAILLEQYDAQSNRLLARDLWDITSIDVNAPKSQDFEVSYETDALIEHFSSLSSEPQMYRYSKTLNTDQLLSERLAYAAAEGSQPQNCATAALKYIISQLGKDVTNQQLAQLVNKSDRTTSLYQMKQFAQGIGLYCQAVKTDVQTLKSLYGCEVILHIPGKKHFVALDAIDDKYIWTVDLASNKFYYRTDIDFFGMDWTEGTALLISNQPIKIQGNFSEIEDAQLRDITGASGYSCTLLLQTYNVIYCANPAVGACGGTYEEFYTRYGCEPADTGSCTTTKMIRYVESPCIVDPDDPLSCTVTGEWTCYYMRACA
jgi:hypothetical protein